MTEGTKQELVKREGDFVEWIESGYTAILEGLTGLLASDKKDLVFSAARVFRRLRGQEFYENLKVEWKRFQEKGKIKEDYAKSEQCQASLQEILDCLDGDSPDEIRFSFLKKLFISIATEELSDRKDIRPQQYVTIARSLSSGEILVLVASLKLAKTKEHNVSFPAKTMLTELAEASGLKHVELVQLYEKSLIDKGLFTPRSQYDPETIHIDKRYRLTGLGYDLCGFVEHYDLEQADQRMEG